MSRSAGSVRPAAPRAGRPWPSWRGLALTLVLACALPGLGCRSQTSPMPSASPSARPPVVLISLDTLRLDAISDTATPHLARFASEALSFAGAYTEMPFTLTAHASLLTGLAPDVHRMLPDSRRLDPGWVTLAETLRAAGYGTAGVVGSDWLDPRFGFDRGFDSYETIASALETATETTRRAHAAVDRMLEQGLTPFLFVHYYDAHSDNTRDGNTQPYVASVAPERAQCRREWCSPDGACATGFLLWASHQPQEVSADERSCLAEAYRAGVRDLDTAFAVLRAGLEQRGLWRDALVILTSDHGEEFGEHGQFIHAQTFRENLSIPLWIKLPGATAKGRRIARAAQLADVMPTLLALLELPLDAPFTGEDLLAPATSDEPRLVVAQNKHRPSRYAAQRGPWKLIHDFGRERSWLYHLEDDPGELSDVAAEHPRVVASLLAALEARRAEFARVAGGLDASQETTGDVLDAETLERLRSLGYVD